MRVSGAQSGAATRTVADTICATCGSVSGLSNSVDRRTPRASSLSRRAMSGCAALTSLSRYAPMNSMQHLSQDTHEQFDHPQRGRIGPLQVVEEQHQRMPGAGEYFDEAGEQAVQAQLGLCRRRRGRRIGGADDQRQLGNQFDQHAHAAAQGIAQFAGPLPQRFLGLAEQLAHQPLEGLDQRGIRVRRAGVGQIYRTRNSRAGR